MLVKAGHAGVLASMKKTTGGGSVDFFLLYVGPYVD